MRVPWGGFQCMVLWVCVPLSWLITTWKRQLDWMMCEVFKEWKDWILFSKDLWNHLDASPSLSFFLNIAWMTCQNDFLRSFLHDKNKRHLPATSNEFPLVKWGVASFDINVIHPLEYFNVKGLLIISFVILVKQHQAGVGENNKEDDDMPCPAPAQR